MEKLRTQMLGPILRFAGLYALVSAVLGALLLLQIWPWHPETTAGWIGFFLFAAPVTAAGEWLGNLIVENRFVSWLGRSTSPDSISWSRIAYGVIAYMIVIAVGVAAWVTLAQWWG